MLAKILILLLLISDRVKAFFIIDNNVNDVMSKLQKGTDGKFTLTVPKPFVTAKDWNKGDEIGFVIVDEYNRPAPGDIYLRRNARQQLIS